VVVWRDQAVHAAESLTKGSRVMVVGRLAQRSWQADDGSARSVVEVVADELGPSLRRTHTLGFVAGPVNFRELEPQPKLYRRPGGGSKVGSVSSRHRPPRSGPSGRRCG
jgi:single-strand DNA-binding protein